MVKKEVAGAMSTMTAPRSLDRMAVSPYREAVAYEYLYSRQGMTLKRMSELTSKSHRLPSVALDEASGLFPPEDIDRVREFVDAKVASSRFHVAVEGTPMWPTGIRDSARPSPIIYFKGDLDLLDTPRVSVVGSRRATKDGLARASRIGRELAEADVTVVSGLAAGIDSAAMRAALNSRGKTGRGRAIGVIGTPIDEAYPRENAELQSFIADNDLLLSQVPFYRYATQPFRTKRYYFPERNELMAAISQATVIVEASDTSGTLTQARACLHQGRPLFILRSCLENEAVSWPRKWAARDGVSVIDSLDEVIARTREP